MFQVLVPRLVRSQGFDRTWRHFVERTRELRIVLPPTAEEQITNLKPVKCLEETQHSFGDAVVNLSKLGEQVSRDEQSTHSSQRDDDWGTM